jgi:tetratricopeptide (TPR) repeat protein
MSRSNPLRRALEIGCPVLAARWLVVSQDPVALWYRGLLESGQVRLHLPDGCEEYERLKALLGRDPGILKPPAGAYCLAAHDWENGRRIGSVRYMKAGRGYAQSWDAFASGCSHGWQAAAHWLIDQFGLVDLAGQWHFDALLVPSLRSTSEQQVGDSAGLAAALSFGWSLMGSQENKPARVAATGCVDPFGKVDQVEDIVCKLEAIIREAPFIEKAYIPQKNLGEVPPELLDRLEITPVDKVSEAMNSLFGGEEHTALSRIDQVAAAERAQQHEAEKEHGPAEALADAILKARDKWQLGPVDTLKVEIQTRAVLAINRCHVGKAKEALEEFNRIEELIKNAESRIRSGFYNANLRALLAAKRTSMYIDLLEPALALKLCQELEPHLDVLDTQPKLELFGSWARSLAYTGKLDEAERFSGRQRDFVHEDRQRHQHVQNQCNYLDILIRKFEAGEEGLQEEIDRVLDEGYSCNDDLPERDYRDRNRMFLDLWQVRRYALTGEADRAIELAGELSGRQGGRFPTHYKQRFAAEALAKAGRIDEAIERLDASVETINPECGEFEKLVLLTSATSSACIRIEHGLDGWKPRAERFIDALMSWNTRFFEEPAPDAPPAIWLKRLRDLLRRFPY